MVPSVRAAYAAFIVLVSAQLIAGAAMVGVPVRQATPNITDGGDRETAGHGRRPWNRRTPVGQPMTPTARATTSREVSSAAVAWVPISSLARLVNGIVSVGLNALELVSDR